MYSRLKTIRFRMRFLFLAAWLGVGAPNGFSADPIVILRACPPGMLAHVASDNLVPLPRVLGHYGRQYPARVEEPTAGVELEGVVPKNKTQTEIANELAGFVEKAFGLRPGEVKVEQDNVIFTKDGQSYRWEVKRDESVRAPEGYRDIEITSPVLRTEADIKAFLEVVGRLHELGMRAEPETGGLHVHVGMRGETRPLIIDSPNLSIAKIREQAAAENQPVIAELAVLFKVYSLIEHQLPAAFSISPGRSQYLKVMDPALLAKIDAGTVTLADFEKTGLGSVEKPGFRFTRHGTAEGRHANSTIDPREVEVSLRFWRALQSAVRSKNTALFDYLNKTPQWGVDVHEIAKIIGAPLKSPPPIIGGPILIGK